MKFNNFIHYPTVCSTQHALNTILAEAESSKTTVNRKISKSFKKSHN